MASTPFKRALFTSLAWIGAALLFCLYIYHARGPQDALNFLTGYLIEKSLSIDNLFVFVLIFKSFHTPPDQQKKILYWGVLGAIVMRGLFIWLGIELVTRLHFMVYIFGLFLIYSGFRMMKKEKEIVPMGKRLERYIPASPFILTLISIEVADLIFAIDSIPAILAITYDPFIVYTSNIFAILGLRSLYFVLKSALDKFHYLHYAISGILILTGLKMVLSDWIEIPNLALLLLIFFMVLGSMWLDKKK